jgi:hypothetical protein
MTTDSNIVPPSGDRKLQMHGDNDHNDDKHLQKPLRLLQSTSFLYPILLILLLIIGAILLGITITQRNTCRHSKEERIEASLGLLPKDHVSKMKLILTENNNKTNFFFQAPTWIPCVKANKSSSCVCPASFIHSSLNPSHCIPSHTRCLQSCKTNLHCVCHNLVNAHRCREVTRNWIEKEFQIKSVEPIHNLINKTILSYPWSEDSNQQIEHLLVDKKSGERLFFSSDHRTGITIHEQDDDYLLNERWTKVEINTTRQHIVYTQLNPQTHSVKNNLFSLKKNINFSFFLYIVSYVFLT